MKPAAEDSVLILPVWERPEVFPAAPAGWGWADIKGKATPCASSAELEEAVRKDPAGRIQLVWTPENPRMVVPEEVIWLADAMLEARTRWNRADLADAIGRVRWFGGILVGWSLLVGWSAFRQVSAFAERAGVDLGTGDRLLAAARHVLGSWTLGIALLMFIIFALVPWYGARKRLRGLKDWHHGGRISVIPVLKFETWLDGQRAPVTRWLLGLMALVGIAQIVPGTRGIEAAGLVKSAYLGGEFWRLLTAPFLHGNIVHFLMNAAAFAYLGKRIEVLARWPHLVMVFLFSACVGGEASARLIAGTSVGASGGLMGMLGFLLVFETLHSRLVPRSSRRRLLAGVATTAVIGLLGYRFIDNAAHGGGLLAGLAYGWIVFPRSASPIRPKTNPTDRLVGTFAMVVLTASAGFAVWRIAGS